jgi:hypothetical protein
MCGFEVIFVYCFHQFLTKLLFSRKRMPVSVMLPDALHSAALHLGGHTEAVEAITDLVRRELERKRQRTLLAIQHFEKKYGMLFEEYDANHASPSLSFDEERDYFDWDMACSLVADIELELRTLSDAVEHP